MKAKYFITGPTNHDKETLEIGGQDSIHHRTKEFENLNSEVAELWNGFINNTDGKFIPLTCSGTGGMDAIVQNFVNKKSKILVLNGGMFGKRWTQILKQYDFSFEEYAMLSGKDINLTFIEHILNKEHYDVVLMQGVETSTGQLYDVEGVGKLVEKDTLLIVDAISMIGSNEFDMKKMNVDVSLASSQKGLALPIGMSFVALSKKAETILNTVDTNPSYYFDFKVELTMLKRYQNSFSPNTVILQMLLEKLRRINKDEYIKEINDKMEYFKTEILKNKNFYIKTETNSNILLNIYSNTVDLAKVFSYLKDTYNEICMPVWSGSGYKTNQMRVCFIGGTTIKDIKLLVEHINECI